MAIRDRLSAAASKARSVAEDSRGRAVEGGRRAQEVAAERAQQVDRQQVVRAARRVGKGAQIETDTGSKLSREERESFERAEAATRTGPPVDATLDPVSGPEQLEEFAASGRRSDESTADDLVYASTESERKRPGRRTGDGFARRDMMNVQTPLTDPDGSPASEAHGVSLVFTDGEPDTAPFTNDIDEMVVFDGFGVNDDDDDDGGWF